MKRILSFTTIALSLMVASNAMTDSAYDFNDSLETSISQGDLEAVKVLLKNDSLLSELPLPERGQHLGHAAWIGKKEIFQELLDNEQIKSCIIRIFPLQFTNFCNRSIRTLIFSKYNKQEYLSLL